MRAPLSISLRLGLLFAAIAAAVFLAVGAYLYQTLSSQMGRRDDVDLLNKAVLLRQLLHDQGAGERMPKPLQDVLGRAIGQDGVMLRIVAPSGQALLDTMGAAPAMAGGLQAPVASRREPQPADIATTAGPHGPVRVLTVLAGGGEGVLRVTLARMRSDRLAVLKRYALDLLGALAFGTLLATALGFAAVRRGLRPLYGMIAKANGISAHRLDRRLETDRMPAELRELGLAFNAMLDRLEDGVQRLSGFAADLAHDLRTPVNALMLQAQVALSRERPAEEYQALLASTLEEYERLARMIENTLFLARADNAQLALRCEVLDVHAELARICDYFEVLAEDRNVSLSLAGTPALTLRADPVLLRRAVNNLVSNAIAHTPAGGTVGLRADEEKDWLVLAVSNSGSGIAEADRERVFERYYRADPARAASSSTGLGLAIVRAVMQLHGGTAKVESRPGDDTVFVLRFPRAENAGG
jgi:two-component system heavy metal sensor histidine kinase CusS